MHSCGSPGADGSRGRRLRLASAFPACCRRTQPRGIGRRPADETRLIRGRDQAFAFGAAAGQDRVSTGLAGGSGCARSRSPGEVISSPPHIGQTRHTQNSGSFILRCSAFYRCFRDISRKIDSPRLRSWISRSVSSSRVTSLHADLRSSGPGGGDFRPRTASTPAEERSHEDTASSTRPNGRFAVGGR